MLLVLGLFLGMSAQAQTNRRLLHGKFSFWSGGMEASLSVEWNGNALVYSESKLGTTVTNRTIRPTDKQWVKFWAATDKMQLSRWQSLYENPKIMDGWVWSIEITHGAQKVKTMGRNAVPDVDVMKTAKEVLPNKTFDAFKAALEGLLGFKLGPGTLKTQ